jgi:hypothetical protein
MGGDPMPEPLNVDYLYAHFTEKLTSCGEQLKSSHLIELATVYKEQTNAVKRLAWLIPGVAYHVRLTQLLSCLT